jgi:hypothetical protein
MKKKIMLLGTITFLLFGSSTTIFAQAGKADAFFKIFASGHYHMKAKITGSGITSDMEIYMKDGVIATTVTGQGQTVRTIIRDNKMHMIMDAEKMVMIMPAGAGADVAGGGGVSTNGMTPSGSGTAQLGGRSLPYEEYKDAQGNRVQYFLDGARLAGIRSISGRDTIDMVISELNQNVPNNVFDIPRGYQVQDMSAAFDGLF